MHERMTEWLKEREWRNERVNDMHEKFSSVASASQVFSSRRCYNAFSNLQLQSRKAQE